MKRKKLLVTALALLLLVSLGSATTISSEKITVDIAEQTVEVRMHVEDLTTTSFNYQTNHPVKSLEAYFNGDKKECKVDKLAVGTDINCETSLRRNFSVKLKYETRDLIEKRDGFQIFSYSQSIYRPVKNYSFKVILPEGTGLVDRSNTTIPVIQPRDGELGNMNGRRFYVEWHRSPELGALSFQVAFEQFEQNTPQNILPFVLGIAFILAVIYVVYRRKNQVTSSNIIEDLGNDEKMVVNLLKENSGEMLQKEIVERTDYSKAKISGVVGNLEEEDIITKEKEGRSNKVSLKKPFRH